MNRLPVSPDLSERATRFSDDYEALHPMPIWRLLDMASGVFGLIQIQQQGTAWLVMWHGVWVQGETSRGRTFLILA